jgi:hypothetical protein
MRSASRDGVERGEVDGCHRALDLEGEKEGEKGERERD